MKAISETRTRYTDGEAGREECVVRETRLREDASEVEGTDGVFACY
jgi:hypothetical protein